MRSETISVHGGFGCDPATRAVAPPIYQNVADEFKSADEAADHVRRLTFEPGARAPISVLHLAFSKRWAPFFATL
jgi:hypothetical protein